ncbi:MAG: CBS domain-containing protein, partial [Acidimicrobiia bacterium]|nr:CBS domain-containing protein [Acidimicrobiia bacterium]
AGGLGGLVATGGVATVTPVGFGRLRRHTGGSWPFIDPRRGGPVADPAVIRTIAEIMSHPVVTVTEEATVTEATAAMEAASVGAVVVVDGVRPVGILTERDLVRITAAGSDPTTVKVGEAMTPAPDTATSDEPVLSAFRRLGEKGYRHIPVVDDAGDLTGIVSLRDVMGVASIEPVHQPGSMEAPKGLAGVIVAETEVGDVRGQEGFYHYRQYDATELARTRSIEDVWYLMFEGTLPDRRQRAEFVERIAPLRVVPTEVQPLLPAIASAGDQFIPLDGLRTAVSQVAAAAGCQPSLDITHEELKADAERICAVIPTLIMALYRLRQGLEPIDPHPELGYAANYLYMLTGEVPDPDLARGVEQYQITTIDHGFNASTFTARVITSTGADLGAAVVGGIGALSGPLHGGAPSRALDMLDAIGTPDNADAWVRNAVTGGGRIMGFGHRVYKTDDPRSVLLREVAERLGGDLADFATQVEQTVVDVLAELKPGRELYANVEFYAGVVMDRCGLPRELFTPTFASSRVIGWCANILEQAADNRIIRPSARYVGPPPPVPVPPLDGTEETP